jgi:hypothetical protein
MPRSTPGTYLYFGTAARFHHVGIATGDRNFMIDAP